MCVEPLWDLYGFTLRHNQTSPFLHWNQPHNHKSTGLSRGESQTSLSSPVLTLASPLASKPGNLSCIGVAQMSHQDPERRRLWHCWGLAGAALPSEPELHHPELHTASAQPLRAPAPRAEQLQELREHGVAVRAVWMCGGVTAQTLLVCTRDWHSLKLCWLPAGVRTGWNTRCTAALSVKAEGNLDPLLVATGRAGSRAASSLHSPASPFPQDPPMRHPLQGRLTVLRTLHNLPIY